jgi:hypothetical protein
MRFALVMWASPNLHAFWSYHRSHADAAALAPTDAPFTVVDISRRPWIHPLSVGKGVPMNPRELARLKAAIAANDKPMRPHPRGLEGRVQDALDDAELIAADPRATLEAKESARRFAAALVAALAAED